ncbi:MAG: ABC transporter ATPase [Flavobacteriales bacterium]|nr:ABC transporter ATPase [Flavobacteriales bacterium]MDG1765645.1 ABC transporter ATPase [Flavobacteriales bacterium]
MSNILSQELPDSSRVWVYQASRFLQENELLEIKKELMAFLSDWNAHGTRLSADARLVYDRFVVLMVDESQAMASGCSIDKSVALVKSWEQRFGLDFFDRMQILYKEGEEIKEQRMHDFWAMRKALLINDETIVFNNLVSNKAEFESSWEVPFKDSWHSKMW